MAPKQPQVAVEKRKWALDLHLVSAVCLLTIWLVTSGVTAHDLAGVAV